jgi:tellurite resistance protein TehA-like permease
MFVRKIWQLRQTLSALTLIHWYALGFWALVFALGFYWANAIEITDDAGRAWLQMYQGRGFVLMVAAWVLGRRVIRDANKLRPPS